MKAPQRRWNFRGRSFKGQTLIAADFRDADLRGADFTGANLTDADFRDATAGLPFGTALLLLTGLSGFAGATGFLSSLAGFWIAYQLTLDVPKLSISIGFCFAMLLIFGIVNHYKGLFSAIAAVPIAVAITIPIAGVVLTPGSGYPTAGSAGASIAAVAVIGAVMIGLAVTSAKMIAGYPSVGVMIAVSIAGSIVAKQSAYSDGLMSLGVNPNPQIVISQAFVGAKMAEIVAAIVALLGVYCGKKLDRDPRFTSITTAAVALAAVGGTSFRSTTLTRANFSRATLKNSDFRQATMSRTNWRNAKLELARLGDSILIDSKVRHLLTSGDGRSQSFVQANLRGANLIGAELSDANFQQADLSHATLHAARLDWATLTQTQAIGADFSHASLTGACGLATWNIDSSAGLDDIDCRWVYLLEQPKPNTDDRERRPSSGEFAAGEFASLFRAAIDTVDIIFRNGVDWQAFARSFQQVQIQTQGAPLEIRSIENKGDGIVVIQVNAPTQANKATIHQQFMQFYQQALTLAASQEQAIQSMRSVIDRIVVPANADAVVILTVGQGTFEQGFGVTLQILQQGSGLPSTQCVGELPANLQVLSDYNDWQTTYRQSLKSPRLEVLTQETNVSSAEAFAACLEAATCLKIQLNDWLSSASFRPIERELQIKLDRRQPIRVVLQTDHPHLRQLPWHIWSFFEAYPNAEFALSKLAFQSPLTRSYPAVAKSGVRILAILGDSRGIDLERDRAALEALEADVTFLVEPRRQDLSKSLWQQPWDILFFAGHSRSNWATGELCINRTERLQISQLKYALNQAIAWGLQFAVFNSCEGLGLANELADLQLPQMIVMREPVPDQVAQAFLIAFLKRFCAGQLFYQSVREARETLQDLEDQYPCATWLPVVVQNPAVLPPTWQAMQADCEPG